MLKLAAQLLRRRLGSSVATLVALAAGVMVIATMGTLVAAGVRYEPEPQRYRAADLVVAHRDLTVETKDLGGDTEKTTVSLPEGTVPTTLAARIRGIPGVASVVADRSLAVVTPRAAASGHGWASAALTPYRLVDGSPPRAADQIVVDSRLGLPVGVETRLVVEGAAHTYRVAGVAQRGGGTEDPAAVFFTDDEAASLSPHPGQADVIGVIADPKGDKDALVAAVKPLAEQSGAKVYAGGDRGLAEQSQAREAKDLLVQAGGAFGGYVVLLVIFVVAGTLGLSVRHRRRELALLRAVAATPGQVRRLLLVEAVLVSLVGVVLGIPAGLAATRWTQHQLTGRGFIPDGFPVAGPVNFALGTAAATLTTLIVAVLAALIAARRVAGIKPVEALSEISVEAPPSGKVRLISGLLALLAAVSAGVFALGATGETALTGALGLLFLFVLAVGLLAGWINAAAARLLAPVLRLLWGNSGYLATANLKANARGMATVLTALVLAVGFGGSIWFLQSNLEEQTVAQSHDGTLAQQALVSPAGLPDSAAGALRRVPGVRQVTAVRHTAVVVKALDGVESVDARVIDRSDQTLDLDVSHGDLADLRGKTVAASAMRASTGHWKVGDNVRLWLGDGTKTTLRLVAIYQRGLGFGDVVLSPDVAPGRADELLVSAEPGTDLTSVASDYPGSNVVSTKTSSAKLAEDLAVSAWLNRMLIGVMVGYAALAAANTMVIAALARKRELALLRLAGATRRQVKRMVHAEQAGLLGVALVIGGSIAAVTLSAVVLGLTGRPLPSVPPLGWVAVIGGATALALVTTVLPVGRLLRTSPTEYLAIRE